ncbi:hypothetical protein PR048_003895 [Dryococelus australis]|uniref:Uncharacterized protein n=1 Tax=Dryococelus australis TaxID=614101 RepID=A0ABQ9IPD0_9NEOP|nr:hypothetical protein PR048_003895 [Dryococelus australis]
MSSRICVKEKDQLMLILLQLGRPETMELRYMSDVQKGDTGGRSNVDIHADCIESKCRARERENYADARERTGQFSGVRSGECAGHATTRPLGGLVCVADLGAPFFPGAPDLWHHPLAYSAAAELPAAALQHALVHPALHPQVPVGCHMSPTLFPPSTNYTPSLPTLQCKLTAAVRWPAGLNQSPERREEKLHKWPSPFHDHPRENPPTTGIVQHDSHFQKSGSDPPGIKPVNHKQCIATTSSGDIAHVRATCCSGCASSVISQASDSFSSVNLVTDFSRTNKMSLALLKRLNIKSQETF